MDDINADLFDLARQKHHGRDYREQITLFKSTGSSLEDLVGAVLVFERIAANNHDNEVN